MAEESEFLPHSLIADLKYDVEALKKKLSQPDTKTNELILEIESMKDAVHELNAIFEKALQELKNEDISKTMQSLVEKLNAVVSQNETIANGMIAISDKLDDFVNKQMGRFSAPTALPQHTLGLPSVSGRVAPRPEAVSMQTPNDFPPPPEPAARKPRIGLFS